jgi:cell volume regulation protein A
MTTVLIVLSIIVLTSVLLSAVSDKSGIPMLLIFIVFGMLIGSSDLIAPFDNFEIANKVCSTALIFIMFFGGFGTSWNAARPVAGKAIILASLGVFFTAAITGLFVHFVLGCPVIESFLLGSVLGSTDAASVFSILRRRKLSLKDNTDSLLEMESGSNDPFSYILTIICLSLLIDGIKPGEALHMLFLQVSVGLAVGAAISASIVFFIRRNVFFSGGGNEVFAIAIALLGYALPEMLGGNGYLSVYVIGIVLGNQDFPSKRGLVSFFDGINMLAQITIFFVLGLLSNVTSVIHVLPIAFAVMLFMTLVSRPVSVFGLMAFMPNSSLQQKLLVSWAGIRGAASIVFAIVAVSQVELQNDLFHIVFTVVLLSLALQGGLMPAVAIWTKMYEPHGNVMKTFTDYTEEKNVQFITTKINDKHPWISKALEEKFLPRDIRIAIIERGDEQFVPNGQTVVEQGDTLILSGLDYNESLENFTLREYVVEKQDRFENRHIRNLKLKKNERIIFLEREGNVIIPTGDVLLMENDLIVLNQFN